MEATGAAEGHTPSAAAKLQELDARSAALDALWQLGTLHARVHPAQHQHANKASKSNNEEPETRDWTLGPPQHTSGPMERGGRRGGHVLSRRSLQEALRDRGVILPQESYIASRL